MTKDEDLLVVGVNLLALAGYKKEVLSLLLIFVGVNAEVSWTFTTTQGLGVTLEIGVGTPATTVSLYAFVDSQDHYETDLLIPDVSIGGTYDYTQSPTFEFVSTYFDYDGVTPIGVYGKETFTIGGKTVESKPFAVRNDSIFQESYGNGTGVIGFGMPTFPNDFGNFVQSLLDAEDEKVVSFSYDTVPQWNDNQTVMAGVISIGGRQPDRCSSDWTVWPTAPFEDEYFGPWGVELTDVSAGVYTWDHEASLSLLDHQSIFCLQGQVLFSLTSPYFFFGETIYKPLLESMGSIGPGWVSCDYAEDLVYTLGETEVHIAPADFIDYNSDQGNGQCAFLGWETFCDHCYSLPNTVLRGKCLMYDFGNEQLGITNQL
ncbi:hypothetical protein M3Y99_01957900 [Aphelenchoides fujianensis]|nr:hypothetical protein M3Y99_01957900 [Aphelenchoides fujianensis]